MALPSWAKDMVTTEAEIHFGFWDRLKILFFGLVWVTVTTRTENQTGRTDAFTSIKVYRPRWRKLGVVSDYRDGVSEN